jgi:Tfp pilus assembly protein PilE
MKTRRAPASAGLTLIEMLVVIVMTALTATLVMQGIGQGLALYRRVSADQGALYRELMCRDWLRQTLSAAVSNAPDSDDFSANAQQMRLQTFRPLLGSEGVATAIEWALLADGSLEYREGDQAVTIAAGPGFSAFAFQDDAAAWHGSWPPDDRHRIPERIRLIGADGHMDIAVATQRAPEVPLDATVFERD